MAKRGCDVNSLALLNMVFGKAHQNPEDEMLLTLTEIGHHELKPTDLLRAEGPIDRG